MLPSVAEIKIQLAAPAVGKLEVLEEIKGLAIALLVLFHAGGVLVWNNYLHGDLGTGIFFCVSGIGLAYGAGSESGAEFIKRRVLRIMPTYWIVLLGYLIANQHFLQHDYSATNILVHVLGVHAFFGDALGFAINDSFWFVSAFGLCYACYFWLRPWLERPAQLIFRAALLCTGLALLLFFTNQPALMGHFGFRFTSFFAGLLIGQLLRTGLLVVPVGQVLLLAAFVLTYVPFTRGITFVGTLVELSVVGAYAFLLRPRLGGVLRQKVTGVLHFLGTHSLEIALIHLPLMREYNYYLHGRWFNVVRPTTFELISGIAVAIAVTLVLSSELRRFTRWLLTRPRPVATA